MVALLQSLLNGGSVSDQEFYRTFNDSSLAQTTPAGITQVLDLGRKLMDDPRPEMQRYGAKVFFAVESRPSFDSGLLIEPFLSDLEKFVATRSSIRPMLISIMGYLHPVPQRTLKFLASRLNDKSNNLDESNMIAATLLETGSDAYTKQVIDYAKNADYSRQDAVLRQMGLRSSKSADVLEFIRWSFEHTKVRRAGIDAISRLPKKDRVTFSDLMARISVDPKEPEDVRYAAKEELSLKYPH